MTFLRNQAFSEPWSRWYDQEESETENWSEVKRRDCREKSQINASNTTWRKDTPGKSPPNRGRDIRKENFPESDLWTKLKKHEVREYNVKEFEKFKFQPWKKRIFAKIGSAIE
jgi:hypothetical protein